LREYLEEQRNVEHSKDQDNSERKNSTRQGNKHSSKLEKILKFYTAEITIALQEFHQMDFVYGDLSPSDLVLDRDGHICLHKLPFNKHAPKKSSDINPEYIPPEVVTGDEYQQEADWWCFGVMCWELFAGTSPFYAENFHEISCKILCKELVYPNTMSPELKCLIELLLHSDASKRLKTAEEIKQHAFFEGVDWKMVGKKKPKPPFKMNTTNFDSLEVVGLAETLVAKPKKAKFHGNSFV